MKNILTISILFFALIACKKKGCTDPTASNYDPDAKKSESSCQYNEPEQPTTTPPTVYTVARFNRVQLLNVSGLTTTGTRPVNFKITDSINGAIYLNQTINLYSSSLPETNITSSNWAWMNDLSRTIRYEVMVNSVSKGIFYFKPTQNGNYLKTFHFENLSENLVCDVEFYYGL